MNRSHFREGLRIRRNIDNKNKTVCPDLLVSSVQPQMLNSDMENHERFLRVNGFLGIEGYR